MRGPINNNNNNNHMFVGGAERGNPAMTAKRLRQRVKETLNINVVGKITLESRKLPLKGKGEGSNKTAKISLCSENRVSERKITFERQR